MWCRHPTINFLLLLSMYWKTNGQNPLSFLSQWPANSSERAGAFSSLQALLNDTAKITRSRFKGKKTYWRFWGWITKALCLLTYSGSCDFTALNFSPWSSGEWNRRWKTWPCQVFTGFCIYCLLSPRGGIFRTEVILLLFTFHCWHTSTYFNNSDTLIEILINVFIMAHKTIFTRKAAERTQLPVGCLQKMWPLKRCSSVTQDVHMGAQVCAQGCGNTYVRKQKLYHYAGALFNVPFSRFPPDCSFRRWHSGMSPLYHPGGQSTGVRIWARLEAVSRGQLAPPLWNPAVAPHPPPPAKPTLSSFASATVPQVLCFLVFLFFYFLLSLRSLMNLWTLVEKDEDAPTLGLPHPQLSALTTISICSPSGQQCESHCKVFSG